MGMEVLSSNAHFVAIFRGTIITITGKCGMVLEFITVCYATKLSMTKVFITKRNTQRKTKYLKKSLEK